MFHLTRWLMAVLVLLAYALDLSAQQPVKRFRAGAYAQDITPAKFPISVNGGMADRQATAAHDRLHARCLVLDDGTTTIAFAVCDSCMIPREVTDVAKRLAQKATGIPPERILISATHTHTAPTVAGVFQSDPDEAYQKYLAEKIAAGIVKAHAQLAPARIGWGVAKDQTQVFNRRWKVKPGSALLTDPFGKMTDKLKMNPGYLHPDLIEPAGPVDPEISFLSVQSPKGQPIALLANYSLHYVGGVPALSADYFAMFADRMASHLDADKNFVGIMSNGTSGNINNVNYGKAGPGKKETGEQARLVAESVASATFAAHKKIKHHDWVPLKMAQKEIELGVRLPAEDEVKRAKEILAAAKKPVLAGLPEVYARETVLLAKYPPKVKVILQAIRIGDLGIVANPCETFVEIGLEIKQKSPLQQTFTIELANGYNGYLPTPEHHALGGYETWRARSSYLEVNASRAITAAWLELLKDVAK
jgi:neutral ceramidase